MRGFQVIFSVVGFAIVMGMSWYFMRQAKDQHKEVQEQVAKQLKKSGQKSIKDLPSEAQPIAKAVQKQDHYVKCFNGLEKSRKSALKRYFSWVKDPKGGPSGKERHVYGIYKIHGLDACKNEVAAAATVQSDVKELQELEKVMGSYIVDVEKMVGLAKKMRQYYKDEDYKDDKFAKGRKLHMELLELLNKIGPAARKFSQLLDQSEDILTSKRMEYYKKKYGMKIRYLMMKTKVLAKQLVVVVQSEKDPAKVRKVLDQLIDVQSKLSAYVKKNENHIKENVYHKRSIAMSTLKRFVRGSRKLVTKGKLYARALKEASGDEKKLKKFLKKAFSGGFNKGSQIFTVYNRDVAGVRLTIPW